MWCQARCPRDEATSAAVKPTIGQVVSKAKLDRGPDRLAFSVARYQIIDPLEVLGAGCLRRLMRAGHTWSMAERLAVGRQGGVFRWTGTNVMA